MGQGFIEKKIKDNEKGFVCTKALLDAGMV